jgi:DNA-binding MarR family transcriptional regulator
MSVYIDNEVKHDEMDKFIKDCIDHSAVTGLAPIHLYILNSLYEYNPQMASVLAAQVGRLATSFTPILDRMQEAGYICRSMHPNDRRAVNIALTPKGAMAMDTVQSIIAQVEKKFGKK